MEINHTSPASSDSVQDFDRDLHIEFLQMMYNILPPPYENQEINRLTLAYFTISGLSLLGSLNRVDKECVASWVLSFQNHPRNEAELTNGQFYGFSGSRSSQFQSAENSVESLNCSHLASTYCAIAILKIIDYDLSSIDCQSIIRSMKNLQQPDGCFMPIHTGAEKDLRFVYCAASICSMLEDWSGMDIEKAKNYIVDCQSYDGGFGLIPGLESHGGATYCAVASLHLMGFIKEDILLKDPSSCVINVQLLLDWSLQRQANDGGFQGRLNKPSDTCYAFWIGGVLRMLGSHRFINEKALQQFLLTCQSKYGGFSKFPRNFPDLYHSYYGFCSISMLEEADTNPINVELGIPATR
ncbi:geranylgeranyl transferase type-1 subunit beta-like [Impatiens glandulifera]|uniref:geranylgeranyl transferase type-1 subunit beta-like n=1 Tax=Impatiens glandulifera TaxID=253017 RepID=UPI001FB0B4D0|nr:geranylgeranyl transferase type-1 subunit beta-like [Impatiens glandulifera]